MFGNASNIVKNGMARAFDAVAPEAGVVAQTVMGNGVRRRRRAAGKGIRLNAVKGRGARLN